MSVCYEETKEKGPIHAVSSMSINQEASMNKIVNIYERDEFEKASQRGGALYLHPIKQQAALRINKVAFPNLICHIFFILKEAQKTTL